MRPERNRSFRIPVTDPELAALHELAEADDLSVADYVRRLLKREHARVFGERPKKRAVRR